MSSRTPALPTMPTGQLGPYAVQLLPPPADNTDSLNVRAGQARLWSQTGAEQEQEPAATGKLPYRRARERHAVLGRARNSDSNGSASETESGGEARAEDESASRRKREGAAAPRKRRNETSQDPDYAPGQARRTHKKGKHAAPQSVSPPARATAEKAIAHAQECEMSWAPPVAARPVPVMDPAQPLDEELARILGVPAQGQSASTSSSSSSSSSSASPAVWDAADIDADTLSKSIAQWSRRGKRNFGPSRLAQPMENLATQLLPRVGERTQQLVMVALFKSLENRLALKSKLTPVVIDLLVKQGPSCAAAMRSLIDTLGAAYLVSLCVNVAVPRVDLIRAIWRHLQDKGDTQAMKSVAHELLGRNNVDGFMLAVDHSGAASLSRENVEALGQILLAQDLRTPTFATPADRMLWLEDVFSTMCTTLSHTGWNPTHLAGLKRQWLDADNPQGLASRSEIVGLHLVPAQPGQDFAAVVEQLVASAPDYNPLQIEHLWGAHLAAELERRQHEPAPASAAAALMGAAVGKLFHQRPPVDWQLLLARLAAEVAAWASPGIATAFFGALLPKLDARNLFITQAGEDLLTALLNPRPQYAWRVAETNQSLLVGYAAAALQAAPPYAAERARWLSRTLVQHVNVRLDAVAIAAGPHGLLTPLARRWQLDARDDFPMGQWVEGYMNALAGRPDARQRLTELMNGVAQHLGQLGEVQSLEDPPDALARAELGEARALSLGRAISQGLGGAAVTVNHAQLWLATLMAFLPHLPPARLAPFVGGCADGLGGQDIPARTLRIVASEAAAMRRLGPLSDAQSAGVEALQEAIGPRFDAALALAQRPSDMPGVAPLPADFLEGPPGHTVAALWAEFTALGDVAPPPALPVVSAQQREAARLWQAIGDEQQRIDRSGADEAARQQATQALQGVLDALQPYLPPADPPRTRAQIELLTAAFQSRDGFDMTGPDWLHEAIVLGWRLGLREDTQSGDARRTVTATRAHRLLELAAHEPGPIGGLAPDLLQAAWYQTMVRGRSSTRPDLGSTTAALQLIMRLPAPATADQRSELVRRMAVATAWTTAALSARGGQPTAVRFAFESIGRLPRSPEATRDALQWMTVNERRQLALAAASAAQLAGNENARNAALSTALSAPHCRALALGIGDALGRGNVQGPSVALRDAFAHITSRAFAPTLSTYPLMRGLCGDVAWVDVLLRHAEPLSITQRCRLLKHRLHPASPPNWPGAAEMTEMDAVARRLARAPAAGQETLVLSVDQVRRWAIAFSLASGMKEGGWEPPIAPSVVRARFRSEDAEPAMLAICDEGLRIAQRPSTLLGLTPQQMGYAQQLALFKQMLELASIAPAVQLQDLCVQPMPHGTTPRARLHRLEAILLCVRAPGGSPALLAQAHRTMTSHIKAFEETYATLGGDAARAACMETFLKAGECLTGLYHPTVFASAMNLRGDAQTDPERLRDALDQVDSLLTEVRAELAHRKPRERVVDAVRALLPRKYTEPRRTAIYDRLIGARGLDRLSRDARMTSFWDRLRNVMEPQVAALKAQLVGLAAQAQEVLVLD